MSIGFSVSHTSGAKEAKQRAERVDDGEDDLRAPEQPPADRVLERQREPLQPLAAATLPSQPLAQRAQPQRRPAPPATPSSTSTPTISAHAVGRDLQRRRHPDQPRDQQQPEASCASPDRRPAAVRGRARPAGRPAGPPPRSRGRARARRASRPGRVPPRPCRSTTSIAGPAPDHRGLRARTARPVVSSGFERVSHA